MLVANEQGTKEMTIDELSEHIKTELMSKETNAERNEAMARIIHALYPITTARSHRPNYVMHNATAEPLKICDCGAMK